MVSVLHKEIEYKVEKPRIINKSELPVGEWTSLIGPHEVLQLWLINTVYHLIISEEYKGEGELIWGGGGVKRGFMVFIYIWCSFHERVFIMSYLFGTKEHI